MEKSTRQTLGRDYEAGTVVSNFYQGRFQIENGRVLDTLVCGTKAPEMFSAVYEVLSFRKPQGEMTIVFKHQGMEHLCSINSAEHYSDPRTTERKVVAA